MLKTQIYVTRPQCVKWTYLIYEAVYICRCIYTSAHAYPYLMLALRVCLKDSLLIAVVQVLYSGVAEDSKVRVDR